MATRMTWLCVVGTLSFGIFCRTLVAEEAAPFFSADGNQAANERIAEALSKPLPPQGLDFIETPLEHIITELRDYYQLEILIDVRALEDLGLSPDQPISIHLRNMSLQSALKLMLEGLELSYMVYNEALMITTEDRAGAELFVCVYPVADLIDPRYKPAKSEANEAAPELDPLIDMLISTLSYDSDHEYGADIRGLRPGLLVISQTQDVHEQIRHTLAAIRKAKRFAEQNQIPSKASTRSRAGEFGSQAPEREKPEEDNPFAE